MKKLVGEKSDLGWVIKNKKGYSVVSLGRNITLEYEEEHVGEE